MPDSATVYYGSRFLFAVVGILAWARLVTLIYPVAKRQRTYRARVFVMTVVVLLAHWTLILFASTVYQLFQPPRALPDPIPLVLGAYLQVAVTVGGVLLVRLFPRHFGED